MIKKTKWYSNRYIYVIGVLLCIVIYLYFKTPDQNTTYIDSLETEIKNLKAAKIVDDSLYHVVVMQKEKIRIIKERIDITDDLERLKILINQFEALNKDTGQVSNLTLDELLNYLNKEF